jgi:hypothetical protein
VRATIIIGRITIWPSTTTGLSLIVCIPYWDKGDVSDFDRDGVDEGSKREVPGCIQMDGAIDSEYKGNNKKETRNGIENVPKTAACGKLMIGVPYNEPNTPPFELQI